MIKGIQIQIDTDENIQQFEYFLFLGIYGQRGGREFSIPFKFNAKLNQENGSARIRLGEAFCEYENELLDERSVDKEHCNNPNLLHLYASDITNVYLKRVDIIKDNETISFPSASVIISDSRGGVVKFKTERIRLGFNCGNKHWFKKTKNPGCYITVAYSGIEYGGENVGSDISGKLTAKVLNVTNTRTVAEIGRIHHPDDEGIDSYFPSTPQEFYFRGCCGSKYKLRLFAEIKEDDTFDDDYGSATLDIEVECTGNEQRIPFSIQVDVVDSGLFGSKQGNFTFKGSVTTVCE